VVTLEVCFTVVIIHLKKSYLTKTQLTKSHIGVWCYSLFVSRYTVFYHSNYVCEAKSACVILSQTFHGLIILPFKEVWQHCVFSRWQAEICLRKEVTFCNSGNILTRFLLWLETLIHQKVNILNKPLIRKCIIEFQWMCFCFMDVPTLACSADIFKRRIFIMYTIHIATVVCAIRGIEIEHHEMLKFRKCINSWIISLHLKYRIFKYIISSSN
jgi:hypothetical protein